MTRSAAEIVGGLAPARLARPIDPGEPIHVIGAAGAGASAAALHAKWAGADVDGCDAGSPSAYVPALEEAGISVAWTHDPDHVARLAGRTGARLAVTKALTAIHPDHPELVAGRAAGLPLEPWQQVVADAACGRDLVAVAGTHGKSTTAGWLVHVLAAAGRDPAAFVGALLPSGLTGGHPATARQGRGPAFVVEADEYAGNFDAYRPQIAAVTNLDWDHPDVFVDRAAVVAAVAAWVIRAAEARPDGPPPTLVANVGDAGVRELLDALPAGTATVLPVALGAPAELSGRILAADPERTSLELHGLGSAAITAHLGTAGLHNATNALVVAGCAKALGLSGSEIAAGLASFAGVGRRLERKGDAAGVTVYDDYGHHPTAIEATMAAVRQREPGRRLWVAYEPLTFHRTAAMLDAFADVLARADGVAIADIWAGRDPDTTIASAEGLAHQVAQRAPALPVAAPGSPEATGVWLAAHVARGDVVLVMGGGRSYRIGEALLEQLRTR